MSNLRLLDETIASSVANVSINNVFSSDYDIYKIVINDYENATGQELALRFINASGTIVSASNYDVGTRIFRSYDTYQHVGQTNQTFIQYLGWNNANAVGIGFVLYVFNPFSSDYTFILNQTASHVTGSGNLNYKGLGVLKQNASMSGINFLGGSGHNFANIKIKTYGLRED